MPVFRRRRFAGILVFVFVLWALLGNIQPSGNSVDELRRLEMNANLTLFAAADASALVDYFVSTPKV
jgi:hypothetical protein